MQLTGCGGWQSVKTMGQQQHAVPTAEVNILTEITGISMFYFESPLIGFL